MFDMSGVGFSGFYHIKKICLSNFYFKSTFISLVIFSVFTYCMRFYSPKLVCHLDK